MTRLFLSVMVAGLAVALAGCGREKPPVDMEKAKTVHQYRGGGNRANDEAALQETGEAPAPADDSASATQ